MKTLKPRHFEFLSGFFAGEDEFLYSVLLDSARGGDLEAIKACRMLLARLHRMFRMEYSDNFRVAKLSYPDSLVKYAKIAMDGCCGSYDIAVETPWGTYLLGCNYGH